MARVAIGLAVMAAAAVMAGGAPAKAAADAVRLERAAAPAFAAQPDRLRLNWTDSGRLKRVEIGPAEGGPALGGFRLTEILEGGERRSLGWLEDFETLDGTVRVDVQVERREEYIEVKGRLRNATGRDRALKLSFVLPVAARGAVFENTVLTKREVGDGLTVHADYDDMRHLGRWNLLDNSNLAYSVLNFGDEALALAVPVHDPRAFLMDASPEGYSISFHLGVSPDTKKFPNEASFRFLIYRVDPEWGIRDAARKYGTFFPELFETKAVRHGNWTGGNDFFRRFRGRRASDFATRFLTIGLQSTDGRLNPALAEFARDHEIYVLHHREPWSWYHDQRDPAGGKDENGYDKVKVQKSYEELAQIEKQAAGELPIAPGTNSLCGAPPRLAAQSALNSYCEHPGEPHLQGEDESRMTMLRGLRPTYGSWMVAQNLDPELPRPNRAQIAEEWQFRYFFEWKDLGRTDPAGISMDSLTSWTLTRWINFRRDHFAYADDPLVYSPRYGKVGRLMLFQDIEFAKYFSAKIRKAGGLVFANTTEMEPLWAAPYLDAFGLERTLDDQSIYSMDVLSILRSWAGQKCVSFYKARQISEEGVARGVLFGIFPGTADVEEEQRALYRKYMPAMVEMSEAGWEPVTHARAANQTLLVERYGAQQPDAPCYLALYNPSEAAISTTVALDLGALGLDPTGLVVRERIGGADPRFEIEDRKLILSVTVPAKRARVMKAWHEKSVAEERP